MSSPEKKAQKRGKWFEYEVAKMVHGKVVGRSKAVKVYGGLSPLYIDIDPNHPPDVVNSWSSLECKYLKSLPKTVTKAVEQSVRNCPDDLTPVVIMGDREGHKIAVMPLNVYLDLHE